MSSLFKLSRKWMLLSIPHVMSCVFYSSQSPQHRWLYWSRRNGPGGASPTGIWGSDEIWAERGGCDAL